MARRWESLELCGEENTDLVLPGGEANEDEERRVSLGLLGKLWTDCSVSTTALKNTLPLIWRPKHGVEIIEQGKNLFLFSFNHESDRDRVLKGEPWFFDKKILVLKKVNADVQPSAIKLHETPLWIRIYDLPLKSRTEEVARAVGNVLGKFQDWDSVPERRFGTFLRIRVLLDLEKPLKRGLSIRDVAGKPMRIFFKFERLLNFCYGCGKMGHILRDCDDIEGQGVEDLEDVDTLPFGPWLRASPLKPLARTETSNNYGGCVRGALFKVLNGNSATQRGAGIEKEGESGVQVSSQVAFDANPLLATEKEVENKSTEEVESITASFVECSLLKIREKEEVVTNRLIQEVAGPTELAEYTNEVGVKEGSCKEIGGKGLATGSITKSVVGPQIGAAIKTWKRRARNRSENSSAQKPKGTKRKDVIAGSMEEKIPMEGRDGERKKRNTTLTLAATAEQSCQTL